VAAGAQELSDTDRLVHLLPARSDRELGLTPYAWLIYLVPFLLEGFWRGAPVSQRAVTLLGVLAFLPLYFGSYWLEGRRLMLLVAGMTLLGASFSAWNGGALAFFV